MLFDVAEYGIIQTSAGRVLLPEAVLMLNDFNSSDRKTVEVLSAAGQSRSDMLVVLDHDDSKLPVEDRRRLRNDDTPNPGLVTPIVDLEQLNRWQSRLDQMRLSDSVDDYADKLILTAKQKLEEAHQIDEGFRLHRQVGRLTKILSLFQGESKPEAEHARRALKFAVATRLGGLSKRNLGEVVDSFVEDVIKAAH
jgi:MoxR-like ATPase